MGLVLQLVETDAGTRGRSIDLMGITRPRDRRDIANLGLTLPEAKQLLARVQQAVVAVQARDHAALRPQCSVCGAMCPLKDWQSRRLAVAKTGSREDWQSRQIATLFGTITVRLPRFRCPGCGRSEAGVSWPAHCRSTPALDQLQAHLSALMTYRVAAGVLAHLLPVAAGTSHETLRGRTLKLGEQLRHGATAMPEPTPTAAASASAITLSLDWTSIRSCHKSERHLEVRVGNAEMPEGGRQVFGAVANAGTDIVALIRRILGILGCTGDTALTAFTDVCSGLGSVRARANMHSLCFRTSGFVWSRGFQDAQHNRRATEKLQSVVIGRNMLMVAGAEAKKVA